jgi:hypothetical protein
VSRLQRHFDADSLARVRAVAVRPVIERVILNGEAERVRDLDQTSVRALRVVAVQASAELR